MSDDTIAVLALFFLIGFLAAVYIAYEAFKAWLIFKATRKLNDNDKL